ncbi:MAG TPA: putative CRISPR-associated protein [Chthonomonadales bacterium]|nr:putative CRISPR-associated protein [Chthonomonadales bacterium]
MSEQKTLDKLTKWVQRVLKGNLIEDYQHVSAEYSAIHSLKQQGWLSEKPHIVLVHTDTFGGRAAAHIIDALLQANFSASVEREEVHINVDDRDELRYNLGDFMQKVADKLRNHDTHTTCFAPLGGYKVMTSLGYLAGAIHGFPTIYMHEDKQIVHVLPAVPVRVSREELQSIAPLMKRIGKGLELKDLNEQEQCLLEQYSWLFERADEYVGVNAFGIFLMQAPENADLFGVRILVAKEVNKQYSSKDQKAFIDQQLKTLAGKLAADSPEADLFHEREEGKLSLDQSRLHLYKGSNGQFVFRAIYTYEKDTNTLRVFKVWTNHDKYEREYEREWETAWGRQATNEWVDP